MPRQSATVRHSMASAFIEHAAIPSGNCALSAAWLKEYLNFKILRVSKDPYSFFMTHENAPIGACVVEIVNQAQLKGLNCNSSHIGLSVTDPTEVAKYLVREGGATQVRALENNGVAEFITLQDPFGLFIQLIHRVVPLWQADPPDDSQ